jgi:hypothetical protein
MRNDVDEFVVRILQRHPVTDVLHAVLLEKLQRVVAEAGIEVVELPGAA